MNLFTLQFPGETSYLNGHNKIDKQVLKFQKDTESAMKTIVTKLLKKIMKNDFYRVIL